MCIRDSVNPVADTVSRKTFGGADVDWYVKAEDIVLKNKGNQNAGNPQNHAPDVYKRQDKIYIRNLSIVIFLCSGILSRFAIFCLSTLHLCFVKPVSYTHL